MKVTIDKEFLKVNISDLVSEMDDEARKVFYQELAFDEKLLEACMDFLIGNYAFDDGYHSTSYSTIISRLGDRLKDKCLPLMDQASQALITSLKNDLKYQAEQHEKFRSYAWKLEREWPSIKDWDGYHLSDERLNELRISKIQPCERLK